MHPLSRLFPGLSNHGHACQYRPRLESLEDRLPLGDALGWLLVCPAWGLMTAAVEHGNVQLDVATEDPPPAKKRELQMICNLQFPRTTTGFETTPSALPRSADRLPQAETSNAPFGPSGVPLGRGETVTLPSAGRESSAEVGVSAQAGQAEPVSTPLAGASGLYASNTNPKRQRGAAETASQRSTTNVGSMPLRFEANQGQTDAAVQFLAHGPGYSLFLTPKEAVMVLGRSAPTSAGPAAEPAGLNPSAPSAVLGMHLLGSQAAPQAVGLDELLGKVNYYLGNDPAKWHAGIPTYDQVEYRGIYPGIDLLYYSRDGQLEYDFDVAAGADPGVIQMAFTGADKLAVDARGDLLVDVAGTQVRQHKPLIYQDGNGSRQEIAGDYVLADGQQVGFQVGPYDRSRPLVIDPVLGYSTYLGGSGADRGASIAVDPLGRAYVTGQTGSANFPALDPFQPAFGGGLGNAFVTSLDPAGQPLYSTYLGGSGLDTGNGIAVDQSGHAYVTGRTSSSDFPMLGAFQATPGGGYDAFVTSLDPAGQLVYSTYLGGSANDLGAGIGIDASGHVFVAGVTGSRDFPTLNAFQPTLAGAYNGFVTCLDAAGQPLYSTYLGGRGTDEVLGLAVDQFGHAYVTGDTTSSDFPTQGAFQAKLPGIESAFVTSLDLAGQLVYSTYLGGSASDFGVGIAVDQSGQAYVAGTAYSADFPTQSAFQAKLAGPANAFVTSLDSAGRLVYSTYLGGSNTDSAFGIAVDPSGHVYVTGPTNSVDFPTLGAFQTTYGGGLYDAFVTSLDMAGQLVYSSYLGGRSEDYGNGIAVDQFGRAYVTGSTGSVDFPTQSAYQPSLGGIQNAFVTTIT